MKHIVSLFAAAALLSTIPSFAQDLNQQVQVTNDYKTNMGKAGKISVPLEIPDSLSSFRTSVSYNVFATPYKGSYEFVPYEISVTPQKPASDYSKFYLKAGAGYTLHPELTAVWTPLNAYNGHSLSVFDTFRGYAGQLGAIDSRPDYKGYDLSETVGIEGRWFTNGFSVGYGVDYQGIFTNDFAGSSSFNDFTLRGKLRSDADATIVYDLDLALNQAFDAQVAQTGIFLQGGVFPNWMLPFDLRVDFKIESDFYENGGYDNVFVAQISPKALFEWSPFKLEAGVSLSPASDIQWIYPDVCISADLLDNTLQLYAFAKGGKFAESYTDLKLRDHWFNSTYVGTLRPTLERLNSGLGVRGIAFKHLQYDLKGGWASYSDAPMHSFKATAADPSLYACGIRYADYNTWYVDAAAHWKTARLAIDFSAHYRKTNIVANDNYLDLPAFIGTLDAVYNWNSRVFAGISCSGRTEQKARTMPVPAFVDLGLVGEYLFNKRFGAWAKVGNLLNGEIALSPLHTQKGIYATAGISLNLK